MKGSTAPRVPGPEGPVLTLPMGCRFCAAFDLDAHNYATVPHLRHQHACIRKVFNLGKFNRHIHSCLRMDTSPRNGQRGMIPTLSIYSYTGGGNGIKRGTALSLRNCINRETAEPVSCDGMKARIRITPG